MLWFYRGSALAIIAAPFITGDVGWVVDMARMLAGFAVFLDFANTVARYVVLVPPKTKAP